MIIEVLGVIGSGKSTLAKKLSEKINSRYLNTDLFTSNPFLKYYPSDRVKWSFIVGLKFSFDRSKKVSSLTKIIVNKDVVLDQGFDMGLYVYSKNCLMKGEMNKEEWLFLENLHKNFLSDLPKIDTSIFLDIPEHELFDRIKQRSRKNEKRFDLEYIIQLKQRLLEYRKLLIRNKSRDTIITYKYRTNNFISVGKKNEKLIKILAEVMSKLNNSYERK